MSPVTRKGALSLVPDAVGALKSTATLAKFIEACLDPLPNGCLLDTEHNSLLRRSRHYAWRLACAKTAFARALVNVQNASQALCAAMGEDASTMTGARLSAVDDWRKAVAAQLLVPAPDRAAIAWKMRAAKDRYLPIKELAVQAAIAADEAWLTAHPVRLPKVSRPN